MFDRSQIHERLDRALATVDWLIKFPSAKLFHKSSSISEHCPLVLQLVGKQKVTKQSKPFRFEAMWLKDPRCENVVNSTWEEGLYLGSNFPIQHYLDNCRSRLELWNKNVFGHVGKNIARLQKHLEWLELQSASPENIMSMRETKVECNCWLDKEDAMWH